MHVHIMALSGDAASAGNWMLLWQKREKIYELRYTFSVVLSVKTCRKSSPAAQRWEPNLISQAAPFSLPECQLKSQRRSNFFPFFFGGVNYTPHNVLRLCSRSCGGAGSQGQERSVTISCLGFSKGKRWRVWNNLPSQFACMQSRPTRKHVVWLTLAPKLSRYSGSLCILISVQVQPCQALATYPW